MKLVADASCVSTLSSAVGSLSQKHLARYNGPNPFFKSISHRTERESALGGHTAPRYLGESPAFCRGCTSRHPHRRWRGSVRGPRSPTHRLEKRVGGEQQLCELPQTADDSTKEGRSACWVLPGETTGEDVSCASRARTCGSACAKPPAFVYQWMRGRRAKS